MILPLIDSFSSASTCSLLTSTTFGLLLKKDGTFFSYSAKGSASFSGFFAMSGGMHVSGVSEIVISSFLGYLNRLECSGVALSAACG